MSQAHNSHQSNTLVVFGDSLSDNGNLFHLLGSPPSPPSPANWEGRASNGPTYAEQLAQMLGSTLVDRAFAGAHASNANPGALTLPGTNIHPPINLPSQVGGYLAQLGGQPAPKGTTAVINIGANDYADFLTSGDHSLSPQAVVANVAASIGAAIDALTQAGVSQIVLFTQPDISLTPLFANPAIPPGAATAAHNLIVANNAAVEQLAASHPNVLVVDEFALFNAVASDPTSYGFTAPGQVPLLALQQSGSSHFAPNETFFFDFQHPTYAGHSILAAFADAVITSDHTQLLDGTQSVVHAEHGSNFIFAEALPPAAPPHAGDYTIFGGEGDSIIFAGAGNVSVKGGEGNELIAAGSGSATLSGGEGDDVLATNSLRSNTLSGGEGSDALIANRGGTNTLSGGEGSDLLVLKENVSLANADGTFKFGAQHIDGGAGQDTLRFVINDQNKLAEAAFIAEFQKVDAAFDFAKLHHANSFQVDGLTVSGIERLELQIDSVSQDPLTPYLISHDIALSDGVPAPHESPTLQHLLQTADHWGLLAV